VKWEPRYSVPKWRKSGRPFEAASARAEAVAALGIDAGDARLRGPEQRPLAGRAAGAKNDVGVLRGEGPRLVRAPDRIAIGRAAGRLVGTEHPHAGPDIVRAVLEARPIRPIGGTAGAVNATDDGGLGHHAGQRASEKGRLVLAKAQHHQVW